MTMPHSFLIALAATGAAMAVPAFAQPQTGPGAMRCTVVIGRLSSREAAERMPVLSWVQGYLSGAAATRAAQDRAPEAEVPEYDALGQRILTLCKAEPTADLFHVTSRITAAASPGR